MITQLTLQQIRRFIRLSAGLLAFCHPLHAGQARASLPNIIFVVADDMGCRDTGYSGNPVARTPHLDEMAASGVRFDSFYSAHATCSPGRMAMYTGKGAGYAQGPRGVAGKREIQLHRQGLHTKG